MRKFRDSELHNIILVALGLLICTLAYNLFLIPNDIAAGGFTGIAQLVNRFTGLPVGTVTLALNVPLFLVSMKSMGLKFGVRSLAATILFSVLLDTVKFGWSMDDRWLATLYGGLLSGMGFGLILRGNATTGGTDMLASLIHRLCPRIKVSIGLFIIDGLVVVASAFVFDTAAAMYALIAILICNIVVDFVLEGPASRGAKVSMGPAAVLMAGQLMILVNRNCNNCKDPQFYRSVGIEPTLCRLVDVKACTSFRAAYEPISALICNTITPGAAGVELKILPFKRIPAPFYPFQEISEDQIPAPQILR